MDLSDICPPRLLFPHVPIGWEAWWASELVLGAVEWRRHSYRSWNRTLTVQAVACCYADWTIPAPQPYYLKECSCHKYFPELLFMVAEMILQASQNCQLSLSLAYNISTWSSEKKDLFYYYKCMLTPPLRSNGHCLQSRRLATGTCLPNRCPETAVVYPPISGSLPSNRSTHFTF
jgi:hypothetical protein